MFFNLMNQSATANSIGSARDGTDRLSDSSARSNQDPNATANSIGNANNTIGIGNANNTNGNANNTNGNGTTPSGLMTTTGTTPGLVVTGPTRTISAPVNQSGTTSAASGLLPGQRITTPGLNIRSSNIMAPSIGIPGMLSQTSHLANQTLSQQQNSTNRFQPPTSISGLQQSNLATGLQQANLSGLQQSGIQNTIQTGILATGSRKPSLPGGILNSKSSISGTNPQEGEGVSKVGKGVSTSVSMDGRTEGCSKNRNSIGENSNVSNPDRNIEQGKTEQGSSHGDILLADEGVARECETEGETEGPRNPNGNVEGLRPKNGNSSVEKATIDSKVDPVDHSQNCFLNGQQVPRKVDEGDALYDEQGLFQVLGNYVAPEDNNWNKDPEGNNWDKNKGFVNTDIHRGKLDSSSPVEPFLQRHVSGYEENSNNERHVFGESPKKIPVVSVAKDHTAIRTSKRQDGDILNSLLVQQFGTAERGNRYREDNLAINNGFMNGVRRNMGNVALGRTIPHGHPRIFENNGLENVPMVIEGGNSDVNYGRNEGRNLDDESDYSSSFDELIYNDELLFGEEMGDDDGDSSDTCSVRGSDVVSGDEMLNREYQKIPIHREGATGSAVSEDNALNSLKDEALRELSVVSPVVSPSGGRKNVIGKSTTIQGVDRRVDDRIGDSKHSYTSYTPNSRVNNKLYSSQKDITSGYYKSISPHKRFHDLDKPPEVDSPTNATPHRKSTITEGRKREKQAASLLFGLAASSEDPAESSSASSANGNGTLDDVFQGLSGRKSSMSHNSVGSARMSNYNHPESTVFTDNKATPSTSSTAGQIGRPQNRGGRVLDGPNQRNSYGASNEIQVPGSSGDGANRISNPSNGQIQFRQSRIRKPTLQKLDEPFPGKDPRNKILDGSKNGSISSKCSGLYEGQINSKGRKHGVGRLQWTNYVYEGVWVNGKRHGRGLLRSLDDPKLYRSFLYYYGQKLDYNAQNNLKYGFTKPVKKPIKGNTPRADTCSITRLDISSTTADTSIKNNIQIDPTQVSATDSVEITTKEIKDSIDNFSQDQEKDLPLLHTIPETDGRHSKVLLPDLSIYQGEWFERKMHGFGILVEKDGVTKYIGEFIAGKKHGKGKQVWCYGNSYEGDWHENQTHGYGKEKFPDGSSYEGQYEQDKRHGEGEYIWSEGQRYSGQWRAGKASGEGKKTYRDQSIYEGQWKDDLRSGRGLYTWLDGRKYEGQWKNGKKDGIGVEWVEGGARYDGGWKHGKRHGKGIHHFVGGERYEGDWCEGKKHGRAKEIYGDNEFFEGQWLNDCRHGYGRYLWEDGRKYIGEWEHGKKHGAGVETYPNGSVYDGQWQGSMRNGIGHHTWPNGSVYLGEWRNGKKDGFGKYTFVSGEIYDGQWLEDKRHGKGKNVYATGEIYAGQWVLDQKQGYATETYPEGGVYQGQWRNNKRNGEGKYVWADGREYSGQWKDGGIHGYGSNKFTNGIVYEGQWLNGISQGFGKERYPGGGVYEGQWVNNRRHGWGLYTGGDGRTYEGVWDNGERADRRRN